MSFLTTYFYYIIFANMQVESLFFNFVEIGNLLLVLSLFIYFYGIWCIAFNWNNILLLMIFIEVMFVGLFFVFLSISILMTLEISQIYALFVLIGAACESAVGLGILLILFRFDTKTHLEAFTKLKG